MQGSTRPLRHGDDAVTPVVGTVLVLAITVLGVAGIMAWGAPTIDRMQAQNSQVAMTSAMEEMRAGVRELSVPDHSRFPTIAVPAGSISLEQGSRFLVTVGHDPDPLYKACDLVITKWADTTDSDSFEYSATNCRPGAVFQVHRVSGRNTEELAYTETGPEVTVLDADFSQGDWLFMLTDGQPLPTIYAQGWLLSTDRFAWYLQSTTTQVGAYMDGGAVFSSQDESVFLEKPAALHDSAFGSDYYGLWLRTLSASSYSSITGRGSYSAYVSLMGNHVRADPEDAYRLRYSIHGDLAEAWCQSLLLRNEILSAQTPPSTYSVDPAGPDLAAPCTPGDPDGVRSILYTKDDATAFRFRFIHASIYASLTV